MKTREERIRSRAYELWQNAGSPEGAGDQWWLQAEREIAMTDPVIDDDTPNAAAMRKVEAERPEVVMQVGQGKRKKPAKKK